MVRGRGFGREAEGTDGVDFGPELITQGGIVGVLAFVLWFVLVGGMRRWYAWSWQIDELKARIAALEAENATLREQRWEIGREWQRRAEEAALEAERAKALLDAVVRGQSAPRGAGRRDSDAS